MAIRYSVIIPFYNGLPHVRQCVASVLEQNYDALEVLIVDDCDPERSGDKLDALYRDEPRVRIIHHTQNLGTLQARRDGVLASTGTRVLLIDQDDTLAPGTLGALDAELAANPVDILHFGAQVIAENAAAEDAREGMQRFLTPPARSLSGEEILKYQFAPQNGFDWQVNHKVYDGNFARKAWSMLSDEELTRADDVYASFVVCALATSYRAIDKRWYEYHLGHGDTFSEFNESYGIQDFKRWCDADARAYGAVQAFAQTHGADLDRKDLEERVSDVRDHMAAHTMNELIDKLEASEQEEAIHYACQLWPADAVAAELWRFVRDRSYALLDTEETITDGDVLFTLLAYAKHVDSQVEGAGSKRYRAMRKKAFEHTREVEHKTGAIPVSMPTLVKEGDYEAQPIRIFVTTHKNVATFESDILQPVQVGPTTQRKRLLWAYQDDAGDNIADSNATFCELTTQYWAWKNIDAQYFGFCHYRRYFDFSSDAHEENPWQNVIERRINNASQERYGLDDKTIASAVDGWDVITTKAEDVRAFPESYKSVYDHYQRAPYLKIEHLDRMIAILEVEHPDYAQDAKLYLQGHTSCFCNMFIMRKNLFDRYCTWLFPLLNRFVAQWDTSHLSKEALRTPGHLAERLFNIWLAHEKRINPDLRHKQLQCVRFDHPEPYKIPVLERAGAAKDAGDAKDAEDAEDAEDTERAGDTENAIVAGKPTIPIVFAADDNYVPPLTTAIYSLMKNASPEYFYDIVVLETDISDDHKDEMRGFFTRFANASLRFACVDGVAEEYRLRTNNEHISIETYYRFLIQRVLPDCDKTIYLDSDLVVLDDISKLWAIELGDNLIAATRDVDYLGHLNKNDGIRMRYTKEVLRMKNPYDYFQAGVLVMNLEQMRKAYSFEQWLGFASESKYIFDDQDILNAHCEGRVVYLDTAWDVMNDCGGRIKEVFSFAPADVFDDFLTAYKNPKILHFAGFEKPWALGGCDKEKLYWDYAKETPFYERQIATMFREVAEALKTLQVKFTHERVIPEDSSLRKPLDRILPMGSRRRNVAKVVGRFILGKK